MHLKRTLLTAGAACLLLGAAVPVAQSAAAGPSAPVVTESFTPLPCSGKPAKRSTMQMEGCAERGVLALDKTINALNKRIFTGLETTAGKRAFVASNAGWLTFRREACIGASDNYAGGSIGPLVFIDCARTMDSRHIGELRALAASLSPAHAGP